MGKSTAIVWFRNDLRLSDNPALAVAARQAEWVVPVFVLDRVLLEGRHACALRVQFLKESLLDLDAELRRIGSRLVLLQGSPVAELVRIAQSVSASQVYAAADYSPYAMRRDAAAAAEFARHGIGWELLAGRLAVDDPLDLRTGAGRPFQIFTPFYRAWLGRRRRTVIDAPGRLVLPPSLRTRASGAIAERLEFLGQARPARASANWARAGAAAARAQLERFLAANVSRYGESHDDLAADATSRLSVYLHFGCISPRQIEDCLPDDDGALAVQRQLAWRDFYHYVLAHHPDNASIEFQLRYRGIEWDDVPEYLQAWQSGNTGYPLVDAAMRQLLTEGFMHNRARLIVGSFLTKDLGLDWRQGERHFMRHLFDGDEANNNGNWQWIASVGVDPAPVFRRLYNPTSQAARYDPTGAYIRRHVSELARVPDAHLVEPWKMSIREQRQAECVIGKQYPAPIVDHAQARLRALARYQACSTLARATIP